MLYIYINCQITYTPHVTSNKLNMFSYAAASYVIKLVKLNLCNWFLFVFSFLLKLCRISI